MVTQVRITTSRAAKKAAHNVFASVESGHVRKSSEKALMR